jgi:hypothetical protein
MRVISLSCHLIIGVAFLCCSLGRAQDREPPPLRLSSPIPGGARNSLTESWGRLDFQLRNPTDSDRQARVFVFYEGRPDVQYGREVWVPARSSLSTWVLVGPAPSEGPTRARPVQVLLYERRGGTDRLILPPTEERFRSELVYYRKREPFTAILLDESTTDDLALGQLPRPESSADEALLLAQAFRYARRLSTFVGQVGTSSLPVTPETFDGIDHFILASGRLASDPRAMRALRQWLEGGGTVWVMLDMVEPELVAPLLGDALDFQVVDRVSLTTLEIATQLSGKRMWEEPVRDYERPVAFVRVLLAANERARHTVDGWPVWFTRQVGRGKIVFTTLGPRAWYRPRERSDPPSPYANLPALPVPTAPLEAIAQELQPQSERMRDEGGRIKDESEEGKPAVLHPSSLTLPSAFRSLLSQEIGYAVLGRGTVGLILGIFLVAALALWFVLRRSRRPELLGWLGPGAALGAAGLLLAMGESSRRAALPTVAVGQVVNAVSGSEEAAVHGLLAVYRPDSGPAEAAAGQGGLFELDMAGLEGQTRRLVLTDMDSWHWENLAMPAGVRLAPFRYTAPTGTPLTAVARFGPDGVEGKLTPGPFQDPGDAFLHVPGGRKLAVRLRPDGSFAAGGQDVLVAGQFLAGSVLSDRQQRRQQLYRELLPQLGGGLGARNVLLAWAEPIDTHFTFGPKARLVGDALLIIPLRLEKPARGARLTVPGPLIPYRRVRKEGPVSPTLNSRVGTAMHLRFQLPAEVLPLKVERARLVAKINAPSRRVTVAGQTDGGPVEIHRVESPLDPIRLEIGEERFLHLDEDGGLHLNLVISDLLGDVQEGQEGAQKIDEWTIEYLELEVTGQTER